MKNKINIILLIANIFQVIYGVICLVTKHPVSTLSFILVSAFAVCCCVEDIIEGGKDR